MPKPSHLRVAIPNTIEEYKCIITPEHKAPMTATLSIADKTNNKLYPILTAFLNKCPLGGIEHHSISEAIHERCEWGSEFDVWDLTKLQYILETVTMLCELPSLTISLAHKANLLYQVRLAVKDAILELHTLKEPHNKPTPEEFVAIENLHSSYFESSFIFASAIITKRETAMKIHEINNRARLFMNNNLGMALAFCMEHLKTVIKSTLPPEAEKTGIKKTLHEMVDELYLHSSAPEAEDNTTCSIQ